jgi:L-asparaginase
MPNNHTKLSNMQRNNSPHALAILTTGGTFEKQYRPDQNGLGFTQSGLAAWATQCRLPPNTRLETVMLVDSLDMTDAQRQTLALAVAQSPEPHLVIIHGTDTLVQSADLIALHKRPEQTVVFTGAMIPASQPNSDALFNLGLAVAAAQLCPAGCYIAMSGSVLLAKNASKNHQEARFEGTPVYLPMQN